MQLNGTTVGIYLAQAALSLYQHYGLTPLVCGGIMAIQESHNKFALKTKLGEVAARLEPPWICAEHVSPQTDHKLPVKVNNC